MALPEGVRQREYNKFKEDGNGDVAVNTIVSSGSIDAEFSPGGLNVGFTTTVVQVGDTATAIPGTALANRNSISIQNKGDFILYVGNTSSVTADTVIGSSTSGFEVPGGGFFNVDITDNVPLYGICESGQSVILKITEFA